MAGSPLVDHVFAGLCALVAAYFLARLLIGRRDPVGDLAHAAMGVGMAAMFLPAADPVPRPVWTVLFVLIGAWIAAGLLRAGPIEPAAIPARRGHQLHLVISSAAMVYMLAAGAAPAEPATAIALPTSGTVVLAHDHGAGGMNGAAVAIALGAYFALHALWSARHVVRGGQRLTGFSHVVMGLAMGYMFAATVLP